MWRDSLEKKALLASLGADRPVRERVKAVASLRRCAEGEYREALWADQEIRSALKSIVEPPDAVEEPTAAAVLSAVFGLLLHITASSKNCLAALNDGELRRSVIAASHKLQPEIVQVSAVRVMLQLAMVAQCALPFDDRREMYEALASAMAPGRLVRVRCAVLGMLWSSAAAGADPQSLWRHIGIQEELVASAGDGPEEVRALALAALWPVLSAGTKDEKGPWGRADVRSLFSEGCRTYQPLSVRTSALQGLRGLAADAGVAADMWADEELRSSILQSAGSAQPLLVQEEALSLLAQLAACPENEAGAQASGLGPLFQAAAGELAFDKELRRLCGLRQSQLAEAAERPPVVAKERSEPEVASGEEEKTEEASEAEGEGEEPERGAEGEVQANAEDAKEVAEEAKVVAEEESPTEANLRHDLSTCSRGTGVSLRSL